MSDESIAEGYAFSLFYFFRLKDRVSKPVEPVSRLADLIYFLKSKPHDPIVWKVL